MSIRLSVCPSVSLSVTPFSQCSCHRIASWNFQELLPVTKGMSMRKVKVRGQRSRSQRSKPNLAFFYCDFRLQFSLNSYTMMKWCTCWCCLGEVCYCFRRSCVKFQANTAKKIVEFLTKLGVSGLSLQFEFTNGYEMVHKAWSTIDKEP